MKSKRWKVFNPTTDKPAVSEPNERPPARSRGRKVFVPGVDALNETPEPERPPLPEPPHDATTLDMSNETYPERVRRGQREMMLARDPTLFTSQPPRVTLGQTFPCKDCQRFAFHKPGIRCWWCRVALGDDGDLPF